MKNFKVLLLLLSVTLFNIKISNASDISVLADRMERLERDLNIMQKQFYRSGNAPQNKSNPSGLNTEAADTESRVLIIEEQMRDLNGKIEELQFSTKQLGDKIDLISRDTEFKMEQMKKELAPAEHSHNMEGSSNKEVTTGFKNDGDAFDGKPAGKEQPKPLNKQLEQIEDSKKKGIPTGTEPPKDGNKIEGVKEEDVKQKMFDQAVNQIKKSELDEALQTLDLFIKKYGDDPLVGIAYYYNGEVYFAKKDFKNSAIQYLKSYKQFPKGQRAPDSLYKLSVSLGRIKKVNEACGFIDKLFENYPNINNNLKNKANKEYKQLGCSN